MSIVLLLIAALAVVNVEGIEISLDLGGLVPGLLPGVIRPGPVGQKAKCKVDLIFLDDGSTSVCEGSTGPFCPNWKSNLEFIKNIIRFLTIGPNDSKVAYLKYGDQTDLRWNLDKYSNEKSLLDAIDKEGIPGGELTNTSSFSVVVTDVFTTAGGDRENVPNLAIIITDNAHITEEEAATASAQLQAASNLKMMMVCLNTTSSKCTETCAVGLSSPPHQKDVTYFMASKYSIIDKVRSALQQHLCEFPKVD